MLPLKYVNPLDEINTREFTNPSMRFSPIPFWFWNREMDEEKIDWELKELKDKGIASFFIHGRYGLTVPYLSQEWFRKAEYATNKAKELGLKVWIYDEYNWPSGTAGLKVTRKFPELRGKVLEAVIWRFKGPLFVFPTLGDSRYMDLKDARLVHAVAVPTKDLDRLPASLINLDLRLAFGEAVSWESPEEDVTVILFLEKEVEWYIDPFDSKAVEKFMDLTHERYYKTVGKNFGSDVLGFYTDEPAFYYYRTGADIPVIPWSKDFFGLFLEEKGYDLKGFLPALFMDVGRKTVKIRCDFWEFITKLYAQTFYKKIRDWCHERGVLSTGHLLFEDDLRRHVRCEGNVFEHLKYLDVVGVDHLYPRIGTPQNPEEHVAPKIASSAAHHYGSPRVLCESFGGIYWDTNFERMKWLTDWEYVLGIDLLNPHGFHYSIEGDRKRDWPPSQFYHHPFWNYYRSFAEYVARLTYMLSGGRHVADVLLMFPIVSAWANYIPQERTRLFDIIERDFYLSDALLRMHRDYDYVDEEVLQNAEIVENKIKIANELYSILFLPPLTTIKTATMQKVREFYEKGGKILATVFLPFQSAEQGEDEGIVEAIRDIFGVDPVQNAEDLKNSKGEGKVEVIRSKNKRGGRCCFIKTGSPLSVVKPLELVGELLSEMAEEDAMIDDPNIFYLHKTKGEVNLYFVTNLSEDNRQFTVDLKGEGKPELWNPENGETKDIWIYTVENGRTKIPLSLSSHSSVFLVLKRGIDQPHVTNTNAIVDRIEKTAKDGLTILAYAEEPCESYFEVAYRNRKRKFTMGKLEAPQIIDMPTEWKLAIDGENAFLLENWKIRPDEKGKGVEEGWDEPGYDDSTWIDAQCGPLSAYFEKVPKAVWYRTKFTIRGGDVGKMLLDGISGRTFQIFLNGKPIEAKGQSSRLDIDIVEVDVKGKVSPGENLLAILVNPSSLTDGLLDPIRMLGSFEVQAGETQLLLIPLRKRIVTGKSWTEQGLPYYSGTLTYQGEFEVPASMTGKKIMLDCEDVKDHLELILNGKQVAVKLWPPYVMDVTNKLEAGKNDIKLKVTNTATNIITGKKRPSGLLSDIRLKAYDIHQQTVRF